MPSKRRKIPPKRINELTPDWAARLLAGEYPYPDSEAHQKYIGWLYFGDQVPGLPDPMSDAGCKLWMGRHAD